MNDFLKAKTAGLPRWAWVIMFGGALGVGLYLRHRAAQKEEEAPGEPKPVAPEGSLSNYEGTEAAGGLAAAGLVGPAGGSVVPVQTPEIPEALTGLLETQESLINNLAGATGSRPGETAPGNEGPEPGVTGGGPPKSQPAHVNRKKLMEQGERRLQNRQKSARTQRELAREKARVKHLRTKNKKHKTKARR